MKITPIDHGITLGVPTKGYVRSPGLHMSTIYNDLYAALEPERFGGTDGPDPLKMELGTALEEGLEDALTKRWHATRPGEFTTPENIIYSPDFMMFADKTILGETKLTWMSSREMPTEPCSLFPPKFSKWMCQMMAYAYHLETPYGRLLSYFVNGSYDRRNHSGPELRAWDIEWTARELHDNWRMLRNHAKHRGLL